MKEYWVSAIRFPTVLYTAGWLTRKASNAYLKTARIIAKILFSNMCSNGIKRDD